MNTKKSLYFFLFSLFITLSHAQKPTIDSLTHLLATHQSNDKAKVDLLNELALQYISNDIEKAKDKTRAANELANALNYTKGVARSYVLFGKINIKDSELDTAFYQGNEALRLYKTIDDQDGLASSYVVLGTVSTYQRDLDQALKYFNQGLEIAEQSENLLMQGDITRNIGNVSFFKGDLDDATVIYQQSIALSEEAGDHRAALPAIENMALIYSMQNRLTEALELLHRSLLIHRADNNKTKIAAVSLNISVVHWENRQADKAYPYIQESLRLYRELGDKRNEAKCLLNLGAIAMQEEAYQKAKDYITEAIEINESIDNTGELFNCYHHLGTIYVDLEEPEKGLDYYKKCLKLSTSIGDKTKICYTHVSMLEAYFALKNYPKAIHYGTIAKEMTTELQLLQYQTQVNETLSKVYEKTGDLKQSLKHFKTYKNLNDSLFNKNQIEKIAEIESEYKYKQALDSASIRELQLTKTVETTTQNLEKSQRNLLLGIIGFLLLSLILGGIIFSLKLKNEQSKTQNITMEQKLLRSQMTPHFIFNSLSVLQGMILNKEDKKSISYLSKFSKLLRISLENSRDKMVPLDKELNAINNYLELQNLEANPPYNYKITVDEIIKQSRFHIPPMLIQPFIENAIEHGFKNKKDDKQIDIQLKFQDQNLICTVADNGIGIDTQKAISKKSKKSLATTITTERLEILSKDFKINGSVKVEDRKKYNEQGTIVTLIIPYLKNKK